MPKFAKIDFIEPFQRAFTFTVVALCIVLGYIALISFGPRYESSYFPVLVDAEVLTQKGIAPDVYRLRVAFAKVRSCEYRDLQWYAGHPDGAFESAEVEIERPAGTRPIGRNLSQWWTVSLPPHTEWHFGVVEHECGLPWTSRTLIGPFRVRSGLDAMVP